MAFSLTEIFDGYRGDYLTDRVVRFYTVILFIVLAIVLSVEYEKQDAMKCWAPSHFTDTHVAFTDLKCKESGSLHLAFFSEIPYDGGNDTSKDIVPIKKVRQLPLVLAVQSLLFLLPWLGWKILSGSLCNLHAVIREATKAGPSTGTSIAGQLHKLLRSPCSVIGEVGGGFLLSFSYLFTKMGYWVVCLVQMSILGNFLDLNFFAYGLKSSYSEPYSYVKKIAVANDNMTLSYEYQTVHPFPREVFCNYQIRRLGNIQNYGVQCIANIYEDVETFLNVTWIWLVVLLVITSLSGAAHFAKCILWCVGQGSFRKRVLEKKLYGLENFTAYPSQVLEKFGAMYMKPDFFFVIGMIEENGSMSAATLALKEMWSEFLRSSKIQIDERSRGPDQTQPLLSSQSPPPQIAPASVGPVISGHQPPARPSGTAPPPGYAELRAQLTETESKI